MAIIPTYFALLFMVSEILTPIVNTLNRVRSKKKSPLSVSLTGPAKHSSRRLTYKPKPGVIRFTHGFTRVTLPMCMVRISVLLLY